MIEITIACVKELMAITVITRRKLPGAGGASVETLVPGVAAF